MAMDCDSITIMQVITWNKLNIITLCSFSSNRDPMPGEVQGRIVLRGDPRRADGTQESSVAASAKPDAADCNRGQAEGR